VKRYSEELYDIGGKMRRNLTLELENQMVPDAAE